MAQHRISLNLFDCSSATTYTGVFLILGTQNPEKSILTLNEGLRKTCTALPYLKGKLNRAKNAGTGALDLTWFDDDLPVQLQELYGHTLPSFARLATEDMPLGYFQSGLFPALPFANPVNNAPILGISCVKLNGGLILGFCASHNVFDGEGMAHILGVWADNCRATGKTQPLPKRESGRMVRLSQYLPTLTETVEDLLPRHSHIAENLQKKFETNGQVLDSAKVKAGDFTAPSIPVALFGFSRDKLDALRNVVAADSRVITHPSLNTVLLALLWTCVTTIRHIQGKLSSSKRTSSRLSFAVNMRERVFGRHGLRREPFPDNFIHSPDMGLQFEELIVREQSLVAFGGDQLKYPSNLPQVAQSITDGLATCTPTLVAECIAIVEKYRDPGILRFTVEQSFNGTSFTSSSWANMPFYQDFGPDGGKVEFVRFPTALGLEGLAMVLPRKRDESKDEKLEVSIALEQSVMEKFRQYSMIRDWLY